MCRLVNEAARKDENGLVGSATSLFCNDELYSEKAFGSVVTLCIPWGLSLDDNGVLARIVRFRRWPRSWMTITATVTTRMPGLLVSLCATVTDRNNCFLSVGTWLVLGDSLNKATRGQDQ